MKNVKKSRFVIFIYYVDSKSIRNNFENIESKRCEWMAYWKSPVYDIDVTGF